MVQNSHLNRAANDFSMLACMHACMHLMHVCGFSLQGSPLTKGFFNKYRPLRTTLWGGGWPSTIGI